MQLRYPFLELATVNAPYMDELQSRVSHVLASGRYIGGPEVEELEQNLIGITGQRYAIGVSNGLDALRLILRGYVVTGAMQPGDEIIVPANTYIASVLAISDAGLTPVLAEPSAETSNLDLDKLEQYLTPRTRGVMVVHLYGRVCWSAKLEEFAKRNNLKVIEDNAQAIGASIITNGMRRHTGGLGDAAAFSFYPTKNIGALGDAGAVTTSDSELAVAVRALANYGGDRRYHNIYKGFNCRMDPMQAAVLNVKLPHLDSENQLRRELAEIYISNIKNPEIGLPLMPADPQEMVWHQFVVHVAQREEFTRYLIDNSIGWDMHYATPPHRQPCYREFAAANLPITDRLANTCVSLPITRCTSPADALAIASLLKNFQTKV
jgi:dTDP-4-amino-4,6-dideoxygalactose transaminase